MQKFKPETVEKYLLAIIGPILSTDYPVSTQENVSKTHEIYNQESLHFFLIPFGFFAKLLESLVFICKM